MAKGALTIDTSRLSAAVRSFASTHGPAAVDRVVRRASFGIGGQIVRSLNGTEAGYSNPKRIDTGRYRAAWAVGTSQATGLSVGAPSSPESQSGDGSGVKSGAGLNASITVTNNVEYGPYVEYGTESMEAGLHVQDAVERETKKIEKAIAAELARAWRA